MSPLEDLKQLPVSERIQLVEDLWDTIAQGESVVRLTQAQKQELDRRLDRVELAGPEGTDWDLLKSRIMDTL